MILKEFNLTKKQLNQFFEYSNFLVSENKKYNLTRITDEEEVYIKHFYDSLKLVDVIDFNNMETFCDIGSGAGFPAIPIKIMFPHLKITIIEPTLKRCNFLRVLTNLLELTNVEIINDRSENIKEEHRDYYDVVSARAVASLPILLELTIPYVKVNGNFLALKGSSYQEELDLSKSAITKLDSVVEGIFNYELPNDLGTRVVINFKKNKKTNKIYPRNYSTIKKKNL